MLFVRKQVVKIGERYFYRFSPNTGHVQTACSLGGAKLFLYGDVPNSIATLGEVIEVEIKCLATNR